MKRQQEMDELAELQREVDSLKEFEKEGHPNQDVLMAVTHRILSLQIQISRLRKRIQDSPCENL